MRTVDQTNTDSRRKHVMLAAMRCFARIGLQRTSVQDICREANMTAGHLYYYFKNKNAIVESLFEVGTSDIMDRIEHMLDNEDLGRAIINVHHEAESIRNEWSMGPGLRLEFFAEAARHAGLREIQKELDARLLKALTSAIRRAVALGRLDPKVDETVFAHAIILLWDGLGTVRADANCDLATFERAVMSLVEPWLIPLLTVKSLKQVRTKKLAPA